MSPKFPMPRESPYQLKEVEYPDKTPFEFEVISFEVISLLRFCFSEGIQLRINGIYRAEKFLSKKMENYLRSTFHWKNFRLWKIVLAKRFMSKIMFSI